MVDQSGTCRRSYRFDLSLRCNEKKIFVLLNQKWAIKIRIFARSKMFNNFADRLTTRLPGRFKLLGGAMKLLAKVADPTVGRVLKSPLGQAEIASVLGGLQVQGLGP